MIGENNAKTFGVLLIYTGLLCKTNIEQDMGRIKDHASDLLVLKLASTDTVTALLKLLFNDPDSMKALCVMLFFMQTHLFVTNSVGVVDAKTREMMLWSSLIFILHIDGAHITTKKNFIMTTIYLMFLMMRSDITRVHRLTSKSSEHSIGNLRAIKKEFTVGDFIHMMNKYNHLWIAQKKEKSLSHAQQ